MAPISTYPTDDQSARPSLTALSDLSTEELLADLGRALPDGENGQVAVAAFNSSI
jgi:FXSXX-COOH protein